MSKRTLDNSVKLNILHAMTKSRKVLKTVSEIISAYGGSAKCAERWDRSIPAMSMWRKDGIPNGYHYRMSRELEAKGFIVDGKALGWL